MKKLIIGTSFTFTIFCIVNFIISEKTFFEKDSLLISFVISFGMNFIMFLVDAYYNSGKESESKHSVVIKSSLDLDELSDKLANINDWRIVKRLENSIELKTPWENIKSYGNKIQIQKISESGSESIYSINVNDINPFSIYDFGNTKRIINTITKKIDKMQSAL